MLSGQEEAGLDCLVSSQWLLLMLVLGMSRAQCCLLTLLHLAVDTVSESKSQCICNSRKMQASTSGSLMMVAEPSQLRDDDRALHCLSLVSDFLNVCLKFL